jgi:hypothetical protein
MTARDRSLVYQLELMKVHHPAFRCRVVHGVKGERLVCRGTIQPTPISDSYNVRVEYAIGYRPRVWVDQPRLRLREGWYRIPHTFQEAGPRPCLFENQNWNSRMLLATSVMPWLLLWLVFYESWLATGEWQGEGHLETVAKVAEPLPQVRS